jgi:hypothetical protein
MTTSIHPRFAERRARVEFERQGLKVNNIVTVTVTIRAAEPGWLKDDGALVAPRIASLDAPSDGMYWLLGCILTVFISGATLFAYCLWRLLHG